jgi:hypothetical protein
MAHGDITHIDIPVSDFARSTEFYSKLFGWRIAEVPGFEGYPMWQAPNKVSGGGLAPRSDDFTQPRSYVEVDSIDETIEAAKGIGGEAPRSTSIIRRWISASGLFIRQTCSTVQESGSPAG